MMGAALELFTQQGYDSTTVAAIAERAGVTEMTFFRHFPSKDSVLIGDRFDPFIVEAIIRQPADLLPMGAAIAGVAESWASVQAPELEELRDRLRIVSRTPSLRGAIARNNAATEEAIARALESRGAARMDTRIAAAATIAGLSAALLEWAEGDDSDLGIAIRTALVVLSGDRR